MFDSISRKQFKIDTILPAIQSTAVMATNEILGRLGYYTASLQTVALVSSVASLVSSLAQNFFKNPLYQYASIPVGIVTGVAAHRFFYPSIAINSVLDPQGYLTITAVLIAVKLIADFVKNYTVHVKVEADLEVEIDKNNS